jgi:hypothetical protein
MSFITRIRLARERAHAAPTGDVEKTVADSPTARPDSTNASSEGQHPSDFEKRS